MVKKIVIHHSETPGGDERFIHHLHTAPEPEGRGWRDTGYHKVICNGKSCGKWPAGEDGEIQNGRPLNEDGILEPYEFGAHARGYNDESVGICLIGNFMDDIPTQKQIESLISLCTELCIQFNLTAYDIIAHRDLNSTNCPGNQMYAMMPLLRAAVKFRLIYRGMK